MRKEECQPLPSPAISGRHPGRKHLLLQEKTWSKEFFFVLEFFLKEKDKDKIMTLIQVYKRRHRTDFI